MTLSFNIYVLGKLYTYNTVNFQKNQIRRYYYSYFIAQEIET